MSSSIVRVGHYLALKTILVGLVRFESCHSVFRCHGALPTRLRMSLTSSQDILKTEINRGDTVLELAQNNVNELKKKLLKRGNDFNSLQERKRFPVT